MHPPGFVPCRKEQCARDWVIPASLGCRVSFVILLTGASRVLALASLCYHLQQHCTPCAVHQVVAYIQGWPVRACFFVALLTIVAPQGARYNASTDTIRSRLRMLDAEPDVVILTYCSWRGLSTSGEEVWFSSSQDGNCEAERKRADMAEFEFSKLLLHSAFCAILAGEGAHSYRLFEAMSAGCIPVVRMLCSCVTVSSSRLLPQVIGVDAVAALPFATVIEWPKIAVLQPATSHAALKALPAKLRAIPIDRRYVIVLLLREVASRLKVVPDARWRTGACALSNAT